MPFQSDKQRRYMHANLPDIANRWEAKYGLGGIAELNSQLNQLPEYYLPKNQGGFIPSHQAGIYGLAEGGRTGLYQGGGPHGGSSQSSQNNSSGTGGDKGGYQNVHQTGAVTQTPGRTTTTSTGGDGYQDRIIKIAEDQKKLDIKEIISRQEEEKRDQIKKKSNPFWTALKWIGTGAAIIGSGGTALGLGGNKIVQAANLINNVNKITNTALKGYNFVHKTDFTREELFNKIQNDAKVVKETHQKKMDLYKSLPDGHPEKIALSVELEIGKKPEHVGGNGDGANIKIENIEEVNKKKMELASTNQLQVQKEVDRSKQDAYYAAFRQKYLMGPTTMAAGGGRVPQGYNTGGLSNLFRLKNR